MRDVLRIFNKYLLNPVMRQLAGRKYWYASVIRHSGRRSGKSYATPVVTERVTDGFIVPLPYGRRVDWLQNVLAAGEATVVAHGQTYDVAEPEIVDASAALPQIPVSHRRTFQRLGISNFVRLKAASRGPS